LRLCLAVKLLQSMTPLTARQRELQNRLKKLQNVYVDSSYLIFRVNCSFS